MADHAATPSPHGQRLSFRGLTFSIRHLLWGTVFVALGCVALRGADEWWISAMFSLAVALLAIGALMAVYRHGGQRAYWVGFVLCGTVHLTLVVYGWHLYSSENVTKRLSPLATYRTLLTGRLSAWSYDWLFKEPEATYSGPGGFGTGMPGMSGMGSMVGGMPGTSMPGGYGGGMPGGPSGMGGGYDSGMDGGYDPFGSGAFDDPFASGAYDPSGGGTAGGYPGMPGSAGPPPAPPTVASRRPPKLADFVNVAHSLWTVLLAACGGMFARWLYLTRPLRDEPSRHVEPDATH